MSKFNAPESADSIRNEFEPPELTVIGNAGEVVLGVPYSGDDFRGYSEPPFEFESDEEDS